MRPLDGVLVLDMTRFVAGPFCSMLLADQGARVVKVEPIGGEETRHQSPVLHGDGGDVSLYFARFNRNKESVALDLRTPDGKEIFTRLVRNADVLVENFRPGVLERLGFPADELERLNSRLVYCSISGFGYDDTPYRDDPAFAVMIEALAGALTYNPHEGEPPIRSGMPLGDMFPAALAACAVSMALYRRERTGQGARVDMAMYDATMALNERAIGLSTMLGRDVVPGQTHHQAPTGLFRARDGYVSIVVIGNPVWRKFCVAIGRPELDDDPRLANGSLREQNYDLLLPIIEEWLSTRTCREAADELMAGGVPAGPALLPREVAGSELTRARGMMVRYPTFAGVDASVVGTPIHFEPGDQQRLEPAPGPGEHTRCILTSLCGYDDESVDRLAAEGVIAEWRLDAEAPEPQVPAAG